MLPKPHLSPSSELGSSLRVAPWDPPLCGCWESFALQWAPHSPALSRVVAPFLLCGYLVVGFSPSWLLFQDGPNRTGTTRALDCGAGIGRITKRLLLPLFKTVDMVDVTEDFLTKAKSYLGEEGRRVRNYFCCGLQDFSPEPNSYDVIWIQWVIGEGHSARGGSCQPVLCPASPEGQVPHALGRALGRRA